MREQVNLAIRTVRSRGYIPVTLLIGTLEALELSAECGVPATTEVLQYEGLPVVTLGHVAGFLVAYQRPSLESGG